MNGLMIGKKMEEETKMKKIFILAIIFLFGLFLSLQFSSVKATELDTDDRLVIIGAQIRKTGNQGIRFGGSIEEGFDTSDIKAYGIIVALGHVENPNDLYVGATVNGKSTITKTQTDLTDLYNSSRSCVLYTIYGIPEASYQQVLSVRMYAVKNNDDIIYGTEIKERNVLDVARACYSDDSDLDFLEGQEREDSLILNAVENKKVRVTHSNGVKEYMADLSAYTILAGDTIDFTRGTFDTAININVNNVTIKGKYSSTEFDEKRLEDRETVLTNAITINNGVSKVNINGVKLTGTNGVVLKDSQSDVTIQYSKLFNDKYAVTDSKTTGNYSDYTHKDFVIKNNLFHCTNTTEVRDIYTQSFIDNIEITKNEFTDDLTSIGANDYAVKINRITDYSYVNITKNAFNKLGANYIIDLGYSHSSSPLKSYINIEDNDMSPAYTTCLKGNGIRVQYLGDESYVSIIHNNSFRTSPYYNAILLSAGDASNVDTTVKPSIKINYNKFYAESVGSYVLSKDTEVDPNKTYYTKVDSTYTKVSTPEGNPIENSYYEFDTSTGLAVKPNSRNLVTSRYSRIGLGVNSETVIDGASNYFGSFYSSYAYTTNSSAAASSSKKSYNFSDTKVDSKVANSSYDTYSSSLNAFSTYIKGFDVDNDIVDAKYSSFLTLDSNVLYYTGKDAAYAIAALKAGINVGFPVNAIYNIAYQYLNQGTQIQYDMKDSRRNMYATPEDATNYEGIYLDCSSFVNSIFYNLYEEDIIDLDGVTYKTLNTENLNNYARLNKNESYNENNFVLYYIDTTNYDNDVDRQAILDEIKGNLQIGDIITYRHGTSSGSSGHVMMYLGNDTFIHCTGSSFARNDTDPRSATDNATSDERNYGAVLLLDASKLFTLDNSEKRCLFNDGSITASNKVWSFSVIRILNKDGITYSADGINRNSIPGLLIEKTSVKPHMSTVTSGETISYTITLTNSGTCVLNGIKVTDIIDSNCSYVLNSINHDGSIVGNNISWNNIIIRPNETIILSYDVIVNNNVEYGTIINSSSAKINGVITNEIYHIVGRDLDSNEVTTYVNDVITNNTTYVAWNDFFDDLYDNTSIDINIKTYLSAQKGLYSLLYSNSTYGLNSSNTMYPICLPDMYGGLSPAYCEDNMIRLVKNDYLEAGDIILTRYTDSNSNKIYEHYMYVNEDCIVQVIDDNGSYKIENIITNEYSSDLFLTQLIGYSFYAILRPSIAPSS